MEAILHTIQIVIVISYAWGPSTAEKMLRCESDSGAITLNSIYDSYTFLASTPAEGPYTCEWLFISPDPSAKMSFAFSKLNIDCDTHLTMYDGSSSNSKVITDMSCFMNGAEMKPAVTTGNGLFLKLKIGYSYGFLNDFTISIVYGKDESDCRENGTGSFHRVIFKPIRLSSPLFPQNYPANYSCEYLLTAKGIGLDLTFLFLDVGTKEADLNCQAYVNIQGVFSDGMLNKTICGSTTPNKTYHLLMPILLIEFRSNGYTDPGQVGYLAEISPVKRGDKRKSTTTTQTTTTSTETTTDPENNIGEIIVPVVIILLVSVCYIIICRRRINRCLRTLDSAIELCTKEREPLLCSPTTK